MQHKDRGEAPLNPGGRPGDGPGKAARARPDAGERPVAERAVDRDMVAMAISRATAAFVVVTRRNPLWALAAGTMANIITLHL